MKRRSLMILGLVGVMALSGLAGCGNESSTSEATVEVETQATSEPEAVAESVAEEEPEEEVVAASSEAEPEEEVEATSEPEEAAEADATEETTEELSEEPWGTVYAVTIGTYKQAIDEKWDEGKLLENGLSTNLLRDYEYDENGATGYSFVDVIVGDEVPELIIGPVDPDLTQIYAMYTIVDGVETEVFVSGLRELYYLEELTEQGDYGFYTVGSNGATSQEFLYSYWDVDHLHVYQAYSREEAEDGTLTYMEGSASGNPEVVEYTTAIDAETVEMNIENTANHIYVPTNRSFAD